MEVIRLESKICEKGKECLHFRIKELVASFDEQDKINPEKLSVIRQKLKELAKLVRKFEAEMTEKFNPDTGIYPCIDPMQIAWGRRAFQTEIRRLKKIKIVQRANHLLANEGSK
jgi:hypothetical protein